MIPQNYQPVRPCMIYHNLQLHVISLLELLTVYQDLVLMFLPHLVNYHVITIYLVNVAGME